MMSQPPLQELRLREFRCFREQQTARLAPLTLLVGDNSTGKTSFLAAIRATLEVANYNADPDFRAFPYDLGAFAEIVYRQSRNGGPRQYSIPVCLVVKQVCHRPDWHQGRQMGRRRGQRNRSAEIVMR